MKDMFKRNLFTLIGRDHVSGVITRYFILTLLKPAILRCPKLKKNIFFNWKVVVNNFVFSLYFAISSERSRIKKSFENVADKTKLYLFQEYGQCFYKLLTSCCIFSIWYAIIIYKQYEFISFMKLVVIMHELLLVQQDWNKNEMLNLWRLP